MRWLILLIMPHPAPHVASRIVLVAAAFVTFAAAITSQIPKGLSDFDQSFYLTIAYDIDRYGVFSNGMFDKTDSTREAPPPGMFFVPGYPLLVLAAMKIDSRFAKAVACSVEANHNKRNVAECEVYATPMHIIHAFLLGLGVLAVALSAELIFGSARVFWIAGVLATGGLSAKADLFSYIMTKSMTVSLYSIFALFVVLAWKSSLPRLAVPDPCPLHRLDTHHAFARLVERPVARKQVHAVGMEPHPGIRNRMPYRGRAVDGSKPFFSGEVGADGRIWLRDAHRTVRLQ